MTRLRFTLAQLMAVVFCLGFGFAGWATGAAGLGATAAWGGRTGGPGTLPHP